MGKKRLFFTLSVAVLALVMAAALFACGNGNNDNNDNNGNNGGNDNEPVDRVLTESEVRDYFDNLSDMYPDPVRIEILAEGEIWIYEYNLNADGRKVASYSQSSVDGTYFSGRVYGTVGNDKQSYGVAYNGVLDKLQQWEYEIGVNELISEAQYFRDMFVNVAYQGIEEYAKANGDVDVTYSGTWHAYDTVEIGLKSKAVTEINGSNAYGDVSVDVVIDRNKIGNEEETLTVSSVKLTFEPMAEYINPAYDVGRIVYEMSVNESALELGSIGSYKQEIDSVNIYLRGGLSESDMPAGFNFRVNPGQEVEIPAPISLPNGIDVEKFAGWYYDEQLTMPVENGVFYAPYANEYADIYPKYDLGEQKLELNGGQLDADSASAAAYTYLISEFDYKVTPQKDGYAFDGWYLDSALTQSVSNYYGTVRNPSQTLYAKYSESVKISFETNVDGYKIAPVYGAAGNYMGLPKAFQRGKCFVGWFEDEALTVPSDDVAPASDKTYYAKFVEGITIDIKITETTNSDYSYLPKFVTVPVGGDYSDLYNALYGEIRYYLPQIYGKIFDTFMFDNGQTMEEAAKTGYYPPSDTAVTAVYSEPHTFGIIVTDLDGVQHEFDISADHGYIQEIKFNYGYETMYEFLNNYIWNKMSSYFMDNNCYIERIYDGNGNEITDETMWFNVSIVIRADVAEYEE